MRVKRSVATTLVASLRDAAPPPAWHRTSAAAAALVAASTSHRINGYLLRFARAAGMSDVVRLLEPVVGAALAAHLRAVGEVALVGAALDEAGLPYAVMKGPVLAEMVHGQPHLRRYEDIDILVPPAAFGLALCALEAHGYRTLVRNWVLMKDRMLGEVQIAREGGVPVDLHWHIINDRELREASALDTTSLIDRRVHVQIAGRTVPTLAPTDAFVALAVHATISGGDRLIWLKDVDLFVRRGNPVWGDVAALSIGAGVGRLVATAVARTSAVLDTPVSDEIRDLASPAWRAVTQLAARLAPPQRTLGARSVSRSVAHASGADQHAPYAAMALGALAYVREGGPLASAPGTDWNAASTGSVLHDAGGRAARREFLRAVERAECACP